LKPALSEEHCLLVLKREPPMTALNQTVRKKEKQLLVSMLSHIQTERESEREQLLVNAFSLNH